MRYYVIINGVNSLTIEGLAIRTLPPISKPAMRNLREEIDGRDGDITTELGYGAYDRPLEIGLFGDYDINKIISFFNSKGTIIFSDEPDKYYNFEIVDKIDYTKLVKFRTAMINIHCQPFKYPVSEEPQVEEYEYVEATGTNITLDNTSETIFNKIDLKGNTSQDGTPTPTSPIPVNVVSGDNTINICGKNLLDIPDGTNTSGGLTVTRSNGKITFVGTATSTYPNTGGFSFILAPGTYTISSTNNNYDFYFWFRNSNNDLINSANLLKGTKTITVKSNEITILVIGVEHLTTGTTYNIETSIQIEKGSTATTYEPYIGSSYPIQLGDIELCKIGDYQDYIYKDSGSWYLHKEIGKVVLDGSENWAKYSGTKRYYLQMEGILVPSTNSEKALIISNLFTTKTANYTSGATDADAIALQTDEILLIRYVAYNNETLANFKTWLSTHNTIVYYVLATPTTEEITDTTLISQLEALWNANSYRGQTNITQTSNDLPFMMEVSALKLGSDHLEVNNIGNVYSKPTIELEGTGIVDIYLNDVQILEADLTDNNNIVIDTESMEAYNPDTNALANRQVTGDYSKIKLEPGENDLRFSGDLSKATVTKYKRWL